MIFRSEMAGMTSAASWAIRHIAKASTRTSMESRIRSASTAGGQDDAAAVESRLNNWSKSELLMGAQSCRGFHRVPSGCRQPWHDATLLPRQGRGRFQAHNHTID